VLKLQSEIAGAVASALKVRLLADTVTKIEVGGTRNPAAFDAYLRASQLYLASQPPLRHTSVRWHSHPAMPECCATTVSLP